MKKLCFTLKFGDISHCVDGMYYYNSLHKHKYYMVLNQLEYLVHKKILKRGYVIIEK